MRRKSDGKIILIDFGAVKQVAEVESNQHGHTAFTRHIGTPGYSPSEQSQGNPRFSSDIYALGIIAIQSLTGLSAKHITTDAKTGELNWQGNFKVSPKLVSVINKMVFYDYRKRYQSGEEALQAIKVLKPKSPPWKVFIAVGFATALGISVIIFYLFFKPQDINYLVYENNNYGIKIKRPDNWKIQNLGGSDLTDEVAKLFPVNQSESSDCPLYIFINVDDFPEGRIFSVNEYKNFALRQIQKINPNTKVTDSSSSATTLSNFGAYKLVYTRRDGECNLRVMEIGTVRNGKAYFISYTAEEKQYSQFLPTVERMINSFEIVEGN